MRTVLTAGAFFLAAASSLFGQWKGQGRLGSGQAQDTTLLIGVYDPRISPLSAQRFVPSYRMGRLFYSGLRAHDTAQTAGINNASLPTINGSYGADNCRALVIGIDFGGCPRIQIGSQNTDSNRVEYLLELGFGDSSGTCCGPAIALTRTKSPLGGNAPMSNNDQIGSLWFCSADGVTVACGAKILATAFGNMSAGNVPTRLIFMTSASGTTALSRWELRGDGNFWPFDDTTYNVGGSDASFTKRVATVYAARSSFVRVTPTYGANITIDAHLGEFFEVEPTNGVAFTLNAPTSTPGGAGTPASQQITIRIKNTTGGALGAATFTGGAGGYRLGAAWTQPATGFSRSITFVWDRTNWIEVSRTAADVAN